MTADNKVEFTVQEIRALMESLHQNRISALRIKKGDFSLELEGASGTAAAFPAVSDPLPPFRGAEAQASAQASRVSYEGNVVKSPIVGTFYAAPDPGSPAFVAVGASVKPGETLFIIESMKLMNEVASEFSGTVREILVENGQGVEFGQPIMIIL